MRIFNKIVVVILLLALIGVVFITALQPSNSFDVAINGLGSLVATLEVINLSLRVGGALGIDVLLAVLLFLEFRRGAQSARVAAIRRGEGEVSLDAIEQRIIATVSGLPGIQEVTPTISTKARRVVVAVQVVTTPDVNIPNKVDEVAETVRNTVQDGMGLKLKGKPSVSIRHTE